MMSKGGRFGKYGEIKRMSRLRKARTGHSYPTGGGAQETRGTAFQKKKKPEKSKMTIRPAKGSDVAFIQGLSKLVFSRYGPYEDILSAWFESDITITLLAFMKKRPVGFAMLGRHPHEGDSHQVAELLAIAVEPTKQKRGVADFLMNEILGKARKLRIEIVLLHTALENGPAQRLFIKHMFAPSGIKKSFYPKGQDALLMVNHMKWYGHEDVL